jgi:hypothetical protein
MNNEASIESYMQIYNVLDKFNEDVSKLYLNDQYWDFNEFVDLLNKIEASGIMQDENFNMAKFYFHLTNTPFLLNDVYIGYDSQNNELGKFTGKHEHGNFIKQTNTPIDNYRCMCNKSDFEIKQENIYKMYQKLSKYMTLYKNLYLPPTKDSFDAMKDVTVFAEGSEKKYLYVSDVEALKNFYMGKVCELVEARENFTFSCNLHHRGIDNEELNKLNAYDKMSYLANNFGNVVRDIDKIKDEKKYSFNNQKLYLTNYLDGKGLGRKTWKNYKNYDPARLKKRKKQPEDLAKPKKPGIHQITKNPLFYFEIALYLGLPSSNDIEHFMNLHGFSMNSDMLYFGDVYFGKRIYHIMYRDVKRWIDAGIDYNLLNSMFNMDIQRKESESIAKTPSKKIEPTIPFEF